MVAIDKLSQIEAQANEWERLASLTFDPLSRAFYLAHAKKLKEILHGDSEAQEEA